MKKSYLQFISYYLPEKILTNSEISEKHPEWSVEKISEKTGIESRHISAENEFASSMAFEAAEQLFKEIDVQKSDIDYLILCTQSPDYFLPTTACVLQHELGLPNHIGAIDFNLGCSGYIYGLGMAKGLIESGQANNVLLLTAETYSKYIHPLDKGNRTIFGDAATASIISANRFSDGLNASISNIVYGTDGSGAMNLVVKNGASKFRKNIGVDEMDENEFTRNDDYLFMDGKAIFNFTAFKVPPLVKETLTKNELLMENVDLVIFHQANEYMLNFVRGRCQIEKEKFYVNFKDIGNTVSSTIPIAIRRAYDDGSLKDKKTLLLAGFGVGLSMGALILTFEQ